MMCNKPSATTTSSAPQKQEHNDLYVLPPSAIRDLIGHSLPDDILCLRLTQSQLSVLREKESRVAAQATRISELERELRRERVMGSEAQQHAIGELGESVRRLEGERAEAMQRVKAVEADRETLKSGRFVQLLQERVKELGKELEERKEMGEGEVGDKVDRKLIDLEVRKWRAAHDELVAGYETYKKQTAAIETALTKGVEDLEKEKKTLNERIALLQTRAALNGRIHEDAVNGLKKEVEDLKTQLGYLAKEKMKRDETIALLNSQAANNAKVQEGNKTKIKELTDTVAKRTAELAKAQGQVEDIVQENGLLRAEIHEAAEACKAKMRELIKERRERRERRRAEAVQEWEGIWKPLLERMKGRRAEVVREGLGRWMQEYLTL